jgi:hypothetical protein
MALFDIFNKIKQSGKILNTTTINKLIIKIKIQNHEQSTLHYRCDLNY